MGRTRRIISFAVNLFVGIMALIAWLQMAFAGGLDFLAARGLLSLRYFTVLSNLFLGVVSFAYAASQLRCLRQGALEVPRAVHVLKYVAATAVGVTFLTVMAFLGPTMGYDRMFVGPNFWMHLVLPLLGIGSFCLLEGDYRLGLRDNLVAIVPTLLYGIFYLGNIFVNGVGEGATSNDWYGFTLWGLDKTPLVMLVMLLVSFLIGLAIRAANARLAARSLYLN